MCAASLPWAGSGFLLHQVEPDRLHFRAQINALDLQHVMQFRHRALRQSADALFANRFWKSADAFRNLQPVEKMRPASRAKL